MLPETAFEILLQSYGSHSAAARAINLSVQYYRDIRNGRVRAAKRTQDYIILKAQEVAANPKEKPSWNTPFY